MRLRVASILMALTLALLAAPLAADAQPAGKIPAVGVLLPGTPALDSPLLEAFRQGLGDLGYVEGQNVALEHRYAERMVSQLPELAADLVRLNVDVMVAGGDVAILAAKRTTRTIPVVMAGSSDPLGHGLVASFARPGGNITGLTLLSPDIFAQRLALLHEVLPKPSRVAVLWNVTNPVNAVAWTATQAAARGLDVTLQSLEVRGPHDVGRALATMASARPDGLIVCSDSLIAHDIKRVMDLAATNWIPVIYEARESVVAGGLMAYDVSRADLFRRAANYVDKILKGAKPADLPVEQPTKFELVINMKTAKALGLTIPPSVLSRADEVIR